MDKKTYVLAKDVTLFDRSAIHAYPGHDVILPFSLLEELGKAMNDDRHPDRAWDAKATCREIDRLKGTGDLIRGVALQNGGNLRIEMNHQGAIDHPTKVDCSIPENRIIASAYHLKEEGKNVVVVTRNLAQRILAESLGIPTERYTKGEVDFSTLYTGYSELSLPAKQINEFYEKGRLNLNGSANAFPHQFLVMKSYDNGSQSALGRYIDGSVVPLRTADSENWGLTAKNKGQKFAIELLKDDNVPIVSLVGKQGTGKTILALAVGLQKVIEDHAYKRLMIIRPNIPAGEEFYSGFLPGNLQKKLRPWMSPIYDNFEQLMKHCPDQADNFEMLIGQKCIEIESLEFIRGRSIADRYVIFDETQNVSIRTVEFVASRVADGSKLVLTGDPGQMDHPYLDCDTNGLVKAVDCAKDEQSIGHVTLTQNMRCKRLDSFIDKLHSCR